MDEFDFFAEVEKPKLYICDIVLTHVDKPRGRKVSIKEISVNRYPITLLNGDMPTENYKKRMFKKLFNSYISKGDFEKEYPNMKMEVKNSVFSSNLSYKFDLKKH